MLVSEDMEFFFILFLALRIQSDVPIVLRGNKVPKTEKSFDGTGSKL